MEPDMILVGLLAVVVFAAFVPWLPLQIVALALMALAFAVGLFV